MMSGSKSVRESKISKKAEEWNRFYFDYLNWKLFSVYMNRTEEESSPQILERISGIFGDDEEACRQMIFPFLSEEEKMQVRLSDMVRERSQVKDVIRDMQAFTNIPAEFKNVFLIKTGAHGKKKQEELLSLHSGNELMKMLDAAEEEYRKKAGKKDYSKLFVNIMNDHPEYYLYLFSNDEYDILEIIENMYGFGLVTGTAGNTPGSAGTFADDENKPEAHNSAGDRSTAGDGPAAADSTASDSPSDMRYEEIQGSVSCLYGFSTLIKKLLYLGLADIEMTSGNENNTALILPAADAWKILVQLRITDRVDSLRQIKKDEGTERKLSRLRGIMNSGINRSSESYL